MLLGITFALPVAAFITIGILLSKTG
jgi:hypothetical protein